MRRIIAAATFVLLGACEVFAGIPGSVGRAGSGDSGVDATMGSADAQADAEAGIEAAIDAAPVCPTDADHGDLCYICEDQHCCGLETTCRATAACGTYLKCFSSCKTLECEVDCIKTYPSGHDLAAPYLGCNELNCYGPCVGDASTACGNCQGANCETYIAACTAAPGCDTLRTCLQACGVTDDSCTAACKSKASSMDVATFNDALSCSISYCAGSCTTSP